MLWASQEVAKLKTEGLYVCVSVTADLLDVSIPLKRWFGPRFFTVRFSDNIPELNGFLSSESIIFSANCSSMSAVVATCWSNS